ncbi:MAG: restriction endonuclease subunit S [Acidimicrobiia bacterium]
MAVSGHARPNDWILCRLTDIGSIVAGGTPSREVPVYWNGDIPWLTPGELTGHVEAYVHSTQERITGQGLADSGAVVFPRDTLMVTTRATLGNRGLAAQPMATNQGFKNVIFKDGAHPKYFYHLTDLLRSELVRRASGTTFLEISGKEFGRIEVAVPPLQEQRRVAEILDTIDDAILATERVRAKLKVCVRPLISDLFGSLAPRLARRLADCGTWFSGGTPSTDQARYWDGGIPWITSSSLRHKFLSQSERTLTHAGVSAGSRMVQAGTLLFVVRGMSLKSEFRVGIAARELAFGQDCKALMPYQDIMPEYLWAFLKLKEPEILGLVDEASHGTGRLQTELIGGIDVPIAAIDEQKRIVATLRALERRIESESAWLEKVRQCRQGLAADLLSGRVGTVGSLAS